MTDSPCDQNPNSSPRWIATCPEETKDVLLRELLALGISEPQPLFRGIAFQADLETGYRAHFQLRTASRIQRVIANLPAQSASQLESAARTVNWPNWLRASRPFAVCPILTDACARSLGESAVITALSNAITQGFGQGPAPRPMDEAKHLATLVPHLRADLCTLGIDTAGKALHKRGWRLPGHPAVLKETLAAAILLLAGYDGSEPLLDPMCGSGTMIIEGAYIALNKAPLIHRGQNEFGIEHHAGFDRNLWRRVAQQARDTKLSAPPAPLFASDIRPDFVDLAQRTALRARVEKHIAFIAASIRDLTPPAPRGLLVANLPYGERIGRGEFQNILRDTGRTLRERFRQWRAALLVPQHTPGDALGRPPQHEFLLVNGALPVKLIVLDRDQ